MPVNLAFVEIVVNKGDWNLGSRIVFKTENEQAQFRFPEFIMGLSAVWTDFNREKFEKDIPVKVGIYAVATWYRDYSIYEVIYTVESV